MPWATQSADALLRKEHAWLPALAPHLPLPVPVPQRLGEPSERFPRPWIVTTCVPGEPADRAPATRAADAADSLAAFLTALHRPSPAGAPAGRGRGGPLADHAEGFARALASATEEGLVPDPEAVRIVWEDAVAAPAWTGPPLWLHGDLHPANHLPLTRSDADRCFFHRAVGRSRARAKIRGRRPWGTAVQRLTLSR